MKKIIITGGLGNQMFQYAYLLALRHQGLSVGVDTSLYNYTIMHNGFELSSVFGIKEEQYKGSWFNILWLRFLLKYRPEKLLTEEIFDSLGKTNELRH